MGTLQSKSARVVNRLRSLLRPREDEAIEVYLVAREGEPYDSSLLMSYWATQQQRIGAHETARFQFSAFIIAGSVASLGLVGGGSLTALGRVVGGMAVALINMVAVRFVINELRWIKLHQTRAAAVLSNLSPALVAMQRLANGHWRAREESTDNSPRVTSSELLCLVHILLIVGALIVAFAPHP